MLKRFKQLLCSLRGHGGVTYTNDYRTAPFAGLLWQCKKCGKQWMF